MIVILRSGKMMDSTERGEEMKIDTAEIEDIEYEDIIWSDYPDFCDAYISEATYKGREMTKKELDILNEDHRDYVYETLWNYLY